MSRFKIIFSVVVVVLLLATSAVAWVGPPAGTPPACPAGAVGCDTPINVGGEAQIKSGTLKAGGLYLDAGKLLDLGNNLTSSDRIIGPSITSGSIFYVRSSGGSAYDVLFIIGGGKNMGKRTVELFDNLKVPNGTTTSKNLDVLQISSLGSGGGQTIIGGNTGIKARNVLEFASNLTAPTQRENNAGKITYGLGPSGQNWTTYDALHIVGGGITYPNRKVRIWDDLVTDRLCDPANANRCVNVADLITHLNPTTPPPTIDCSDVSGTHYSLITPYFDLSCSVTGATSYTWSNITGGDSGNVNFGSPGGANTYYTRISGGDMSALDGVTKTYKVRLTATGTGGTVTKDITATLYSAKKTYVVYPGSANAIKSVLFHSGIDCAAGVNCKSSYCPNGNLFCKDTSDCPNDSNTSWWCRQNSSNDNSVRDLRDYTGNIASDHSLRGTSFSFTDLTGNDDYYYAECPVKTSVLSSESGLIGCTSGVKQVGATMPVSGFGTPVVGKGFSCGDDNSGTFSNISSISLVCY